MVTVVRCFLSRTIVFTIFWKSNFSISTKIKCWLLQENWNDHFLRSNDSPFLLNRTNTLLSSYSLCRKINRLKLTNLKFIKKHICHIFLTICVIILVRGDERVIRGCGYEVDPRGRDCYTTVLEEYNTEVCACKEDGCNSATGWARTEYLLKTVYLFTFWQFFVFP